MLWMRRIAIPQIVVGLVILLIGCDQGESGGHMMGSGMMGGGMMGQAIPGDRTEPLPDTQSQGALLLRSYCSQCHAPPAPTAHRAGEWPQVVSRMKQHMETQGKAVPDREELDEITAYLQRYVD